MGLFSFLFPAQKSAAQFSPAGNLVACDTANTQRVAEMLHTPREARNENWMQQFYQLVATAAFQKATPEPIIGPDGLQYLVLTTELSADGSGNICIENIKSSYLMARGLGVVIRGESNSPDWVFSHGDIVNLFLANEFVSPADKLGTDNIDMTKKVGVLKKGDQVLMAQPSETYLPKMTRTVIKNFLQSKGIKRPMVTLLCRKNEGTLQQQLVFNVHPEDFPKIEDRDFLMQQLSWHLPRHYSIVSFSKKSELVRDFASL